VAIDITKDKLISLEDAAKMFPKPGGGHIHPKTVKNWITSGYQGIQLEGAQVGSKFYTTSDALRLFSQQLNERRQPDTQEFGQPGTEPKRDLKPPADAVASDDFAVAADDFAVAETDTLTGGEITVEMPCQRSSRDSV
jgi:hypothetical protein